MMNTLQSGGIPGAVVDGVIMVGSHAQTSMDSAIAGWLSRWMQDAKRIWKHDCA